VRNLGALWGGARDLIYMGSLVIGKEELLATEENYLVQKCVYSFPEVSYGLIHSGLENISCELIRFGIFTTFESSEFCSL
jgi:hypothetical protein